MRKFRSVRQTLLIVGEGDAEVALIKHLRSLYTAGNPGRAAIGDWLTRESALKALPLSSIIRRGLDQRANGGGSQLH